MLSSLEERLDLFDYVLSKYAQMMLQMPEEDIEPKPLVKPVFAKTMRKPGDLPLSVDRGDITSMRIV